MSNAFRLTSHVVQSFLELSPFTANAVLQFFLRWLASTSSVVQETSNSYLLIATASILLSSFKILQLTNVHNYKLHALPVFSVSLILK